jgi:hypothetical protein
LAAWGGFPGGALLKIDSGLTTTTSAIPA